MLSSVGLEVMNSTNPELSWKSVTKGRRSKKTVARSLNSVVKAANSTSPKRVGDFSGSDSDKFGEVIPGQASTGKSENVPLKKRRHLLESPSPHPWASSLRNQDSVPTRTSSSPPLKDRMQIQYPSCSSGDFSGIELLAAAASMDDIIDADEKDILPKDISIQKNSDVSISATMSEQGLKNESANCLSNIDVLGGNVDSQENSSAAASLSLLTSPDDDTVPKISREYWDLNTPMDAWGEPYDDSIAADTLKDVNEGREKHLGDNPTGTTYQPSSLKGVEVKSTSVPEDGICSETPHLEENLREPKNIYTHNGVSPSNEKDSDDSNSIQALNSASALEVLDQVTGSGVIVGGSPLGKLCCTSGVLISEEENNAISATATMIQDRDSSSNISECERTAALDKSHTGTDEVNANDMAGSEAAFNVQLKHAEISNETSELMGTFTLDAQPVASTDSNKQIDGAFLSNSTMADEQYPELEEPATKLGYNNSLPKEESKRTMVEDTCKSFSAGTQSEKPITVERIGLALDGQRDPALSQDNRVNMGDGDDLTGFQEGYDSPYEDGELRGSFLYSWEDNEIENECVDYESDGRNEDGSDAADYYNGSEIVEGGSEGSHGTQRSMSLKISGEGKRSGPAKHSLKKHVVKDDSDNNEIAGKASNAGSGSTVEQCVEMAMEENYGTKRLQMLDNKDAPNLRVTNIDEYASNAAKGKIQSRIEGRSSADATGGKDGFFIQQSRPRRIAGSYQRPERGVSPDRYMGRYKSANPGERDGVHQWTSWGNRRRYTTNYQGGEGRNYTRPRNKTGEVANKIDEVDYHEPRQNNYLSKGMHRPIMRRSPVERDDYFGVDRRMPPTRGRGNYRGRGHYSQRPAGRDFVEDFEPVPEDAGAPVRMPRYLSRRERSFSPGSGRQTHMPMPRRRSRSRSRTRSPPRAWNPHRERVMGARRLSRSPDFRSEPRMERMRVPFSKSNFASDYGEGYISPSRGRFSPQRNCRWVDERNFGDNQIRRRRSPVRVFRRNNNQRFDAVGPSGRLKSDEYFRPVNRPGRFQVMANGGGRDCKFESNYGGGRECKFESNYSGRECKLESNYGGRECKLESNYDDRRRDDSGEMTHRLMHPDDAGNMRRFRQNAGGGDDFEVKNLNNEEMVVSEGPQTEQGEREDKQQEQQQPQQQVFKI